MTGGAPFALLAVTVGNVRFVEFEVQLGNAFILWGGDAGGHYVLVDAHIGAIGQLGAVLTGRQFGTLIKPATAIRVAIATSVIVYASTAISAVGPILVVKLGGLLVVYLVILALLGEITRSDLKPFAVWSK